jgi:hypothetical protein
MEEPVLITAIATTKDSPTTVRASMDRPSVLPTPPHEQRRQRAGAQRREAAVATLGFDSKTPRA